METKTCTKCDQTKPIDEFNWANKSQGRRHARCRVCAGEASKASYAKTYQRDKDSIRQKNKVWYEANRERMAVYRKGHYEANKAKTLQQTREYKQKNRELVRQRNRKWREANPERCRETGRACRRANPKKYNACARRYRERHADTLRQRRREHYAKNRDQLNAQASARRRKQYREDPNYRIAHGLRSRLRDAIHSQGVRKAAKTFQLLGCTIQEFRAHIEALFYDGMSWDTMGCRRTQWQLDHIVAVALFDLTDPTQQRSCFHWSNIQPLWWADHQVKTQADLVKIRLKHEAASNNACSLHLDAGSLQAP